MRQRQTQSRGDDEEPFTGWKPPRQPLAIRITELEERVTAVTARTEEVAAETKAVAGRTEEVAAETKAVAARTEEVATEAKTACADLAERVASVEETNAKMQRTFEEQQAEVLRKLETARADEKLSNEKVKKTMADFINDITLRVVKTLLSAG